MPGVSYIRESSSALDDKAGGEKRDQGRNSESRREEPKRDNRYNECSPYETHASEVPREMPHTP